MIELPARDWLIFFIDSLLVTSLSKLDKAVVLNSFKYMSKNTRRAAPKFKIELRAKNKKFRPKRRETGLLEEAKVGIAPL